MTVRRQSEIASLETPGGNRTWTLVTHADGATESLLLKQEQQTGGQNPPHYHDHEEIMLLQSGAVEVRVGEETALLAAGDLLVVPAQAVHSVSNTGDSPASWLLISLGSLRYFKPDGEEVIPKWTQGVNPS